MFDLRSNKEIHYLKVHNEPLLSLDVDIQNNQVITSAADTNLHIVSLDLSSDTPLTLTNDKIVLEKAGVEFVALRSKQDIFATAGWDRRIRIFEWNQPHRPLAILKHHTAGVCSVCWSPNSELLASASKDGNIAIWSIFPPN